MSNDTYFQTLADAAAIVVAYVSEDKAGGDAAKESLLSDPADAKRVADAALFLAVQMARKELVDRAEVDRSDVPPSLEYVIAVARSAANRG